MRGEKRAIFFTSSAVMGSPPRARGKVSIKFAVVDDIRITPACAGKRHHGKNHHCGTKDHPRVRGEKTGASATLTADQGSPPRARGKVGMANSGYAFLRITPACAGKSLSYLRERDVTWDHPRVRGEKGMTIESSREVQGSPPRARGKAILTSCPVPWGRITPACAGKSPSSPATSMCWRDHPRVRGEKPQHERAIGAGEGSPPRARGKGSIVINAQGMDGITPACAGKRILAGKRRHRRRDHPRVRGEKGTAKKFDPYTGGSPPRARGKDCADPPRRWGEGITPACAGKSTPCRGRLGPARDHPRVRGEKCLVGVTLLDCKGSPPRARGKGGRGPYL